MKSSEGLNHTRVKEEAASLLLEKNFQLLPYYKGVTSVGSLVCLILQICMLDALPDATSG